MPVYQSVVIEENDPKRDYTVKSLYICPDESTETKKKRVGTVSRWLIGGILVLILLFLIASLCQYLYESFGPEKSPGTYDDVQHTNGPKSTITLLLTSSITWKIIGALILALLAKLGWNHYG